MTHTNLTDQSHRAVEIYDRISEQYIQKSELRIPQLQLDHLQKHLSIGSKILDVGCAGGRDTRLLKQLGYEVVGVDLSKKFIEYAQEHNPELEFIQADIRDLPFRNESFDAIWVMAMLHHLELSQMSSALRECYRVLKPSGLILITTKKGSGIQVTKDSYAEHEQREFTLLEEPQLDELLKVSKFTKLELFESKSKDREVYWVDAIYKK